MRQYSLLRAAAITAGSSFGILVGGDLPWQGFICPSKSEMDALRTEWAPLQALDRGLECVARLVSRIQSHGRIHLMILPRMQASRATSELVAALLSTLKFVP